MRLTLLRRHAGLDTCMHRLPQCGLVCCASRSAHDLSARWAAPNPPVQVCYAFSQLAAGFSQASSTTSPLSPYFKEVVQALLETVRGAGWAGLAPLPLAAA